jgi:acetate kinase
MRLLLNAGSSTLKMTVLDADSGVVLRRSGDSTAPPAVTALLEEALAAVGGSAIDGVVHRVVHGGSRFTAPVLVTPAVRLDLEALTPLAPLHNPPALGVLDTAAAMLPDVPQVAVFDTAFHATLAPEAYTYALPFELNERWGLRRFGFHGLSHAYAAGRAPEMLGRSADGLRLVVAHLGNGASVTAVRDGRSVDTTMGFTPLEGLVMGTRSGTVDPGLLLYLERTCGMTAEGLDHVLNEASGLLGVSGVSFDLRKVTDAARAGNARASLALALFAHRARQAIGAMAVTLGGVDALVFTGGIGEHGAAMRADICAGLGCLDLELDAAANGSARPDADVATSASPGRILVIAAREDLSMSRAADSLIGAGHRR